MDGCGEEALNTCIITADIGYGNEVFLQLLPEIGNASVFLMTERLLRVHPFVSDFYLYPCREDDEEEVSDDVDAQNCVGRGGSRSSTQHTRTAATKSYQVSRIATTTPDYAYDRGKEFFIGDSPSFGLASFLAIKEFGAGRCVGTNRMAALAVTERGTDYCW